MKNIVNILLSVVISLNCIVFERTASSYGYIKPVEESGQSLESVVSVPIEDTHNENAVYLTEEEYKLLCDVVCLEAGGEGEDLQRAVTEVIYNRLKSGFWGESITDVLWAPNEFEVMGWLWKADPSDLTKRIVSDVFSGNLSIPSRILYFRTDHYHRWYGAVDEFNIGNVYFSSSIWNR